MYPSVEVANRALLLAQAKSLGHEITLITSWMIEDDKDVYAQCSCEWRGKNWRANYDAAREGLNHLKEVGNDS